MSTKNKILIIVALICILLIPTTSTLAKKDPVYVLPQYGLEATVSSTDEVVIQLNWIACSKGLVNDYIESADHVIYFDGVALEKTFKREMSYWSTPVESNILISSCLWNVENTWITYWEYNLGKLEPGDHTLTLQQWFTFPVIDGIDILSPLGELDVYQGEQDFNDTIIHVEP